MTDNLPDQPPGAGSFAFPQSDRVGQATMVEQSRAVAEALAAMQVAQSRPRNTAACIAEMERSCQMRELADRAFYRFPRAKTTVTGPSIYLARELARCWGHIAYGVFEQRRDDEYGQSEMLAYAWDLQANARVATGFIVPHKRDKTGGPERLVDMRDVYENNANNGARRVREAIYAVLPPWFTERAKTLCTETMKKDDSGKPLPQRAADMIAWFGTKYGVIADQLESKLGRESNRWTEFDLAQLRVVGQSLSRGEVTVDEEFPPPQIRAADLLAGARPAVQPSAPAAVPDSGTGPTAEDIAAMNAEAQQ